MTACTAPPSNWRSFSRIAFFDPIEPKPAKPRRKRRRKRHFEPWYRPSDHLPRHLPGGFVLASSDAYAIAVRDVACYPNGFSLDLVVVSRYEFESDDYDDWPDTPFHRRRSPTEGLRFGVGYADGGKATTDREDHAFGRGTGSEPGPRMTQTGGGGSETEWDQQFWVSPLPPEGPVEFACVWSAVGIPETIRRVPGARIRRAAEGAKPVF